MRASDARSWRLRLVGAMLLAIGVPAGAQQPSHEREVMRRFQQQIAKLQQDNAQLLHDKTELEGKLKAAQSELDKAKGQAARLSKLTAAAQAAQSNNAQLRTELAAGEQKLRETQQHCQQELLELRGQSTELRSQVEQTAQRGAAEVGTLRANLEQQQGRAERCETKNQQLYSVTMDLIARYKANRGVWEKFLLSEPFTGLKSVEVENLLEDMRDQARAARADAGPQSKTR
jgi:predicted  nucleic acid-binding Zn-ribbon protein